MPDHWKPPGRNTRPASARMAVSQFLTVRLCNACVDSLGTPFDDEDEEEEMGTARSVTGCDDPCGSSVDGNGEELDGRGGPEGECAPASSGVSTGRNAIRSSGRETGYELFCSPKYEDNGTLPLLLLAPAEMMMLPVCKAIHADCTAYIPRRPTDSASAASDTAGSTLVV